MIKENEKGRGGGRESGREGAREGRRTYLLDDLDLALVVVRQQFQVKDVLLLLLLFLNGSSRPSPGSSPGTWSRDSHTAQVGIGKTQPVLERGREGAREGGREGGVSRRETGEREGRRRGGTEGGTEGPRDRWRAYLQDLQELAEFEHVKGEDVFT